MYSSFKAGNEIPDYQNEHQKSTYGESEDQQAEDDQAESGDDED